VIPLTATPASAATYWPADPAYWCWYNKPFLTQQAINDWSLWWRSPNIRLGGYTTYCLWWVRTGKYAWIVPYDQVVDWNAACKQQYGWRSYNVFAPGWRYYQACYVP
jgi:hypothetical protein